MQALAGAAGSYYVPAAAAAVAFNVAILIPFHMHILCCFIVACSSNLRAIWRNVK